MISKYTLVLLKTEDIHPPQTGISAKASYNTSGCLHNESIPNFFLSFTYFPTKIFYLMCEITKIITPLFADGKLDTISGVRMSFESVKVIVLSELSKYFAR